MSLRFSNREKFSILLGSSWMAVNMLSHYRTVYQQILPKKVPSWSVMSVETADNVDEAVRELPDANLKPEDLWFNHSKLVLPKPHMRNNTSWRAIQKVCYILDM
ncbi:hypothetical protein BHM03_00006846 [Ensete ventricosum]|nr:hypothetical protein BHM03_00006846 [Ensete ventricosum]